MKRTPFTGEGLFRKKLPPRAPPQKLFGCFLGWRGPKQGQQNQIFRLIFISPSGDISSVSGGNRYHRVRQPSRAPYPSPKTFQVFFLLAQTKTKTAKSDFPAYFHFAVRRNIICFRGKQISSAIRGFHLSASENKFHRVRQPSRALPSPKTF